ncbi:MAG: LuxR C-terminal-related transcriptional regulator [Cyanobacteria bacterium P01_A01_bin.45]
MQPILRSKDKFLRDVIESLDDGVMILNQQNQQQVIYINQKASQLLSEIKKNASSICNICHSLIKNQDKLFQSYAVLSDEVTVQKNQTIRIRARKLELSDIGNNCLLVIIENKSESLEKSANVEAIQYKLTRRESEIWMLYKAKYSYKEISEKLYITTNTVKKHMKNIHAKRQNYLIM